MYWIHKASIHMGPVEEQLHYATLAAFTELLRPCRQRHEPQGILAMAEFLILSEYKRMIPDFLSIIHEFLSSSLHNKVFLLILWEFHATNVACILPSPNPRASLTFLHIQLHILFLKKNKNKNMESNLCWATTSEHGACPGDPQVFCYPLDTDEMGSFLNHIFVIYRL